MKRFAQLTALVLGLAVLTVPETTYAQTLHVYTGAVSPDVATYTTSDGAYSGVGNAIRVGRNAAGTLPASTTGTLSVANGGTVYIIAGFNTSTMNVGGGTVRFAYGLDNSTTNISGGTLNNGIFLSDTTAKLNFTGTGLSFAYTGLISGSSSPYDLAADLFKVSGTIGGVVNKSYDVYIRNSTGIGNGVPRQFTLNGLPPVVVPEAGTFALIGLGGMVCAVARRRAG